MTAFFYNVSLYLFLNQIPQHTEASAFTPDDNPLALNDNVLIPDKVAKRGQTSPGQDPAGYTHKGIYLDYGRSIGNGYQDRRQDRKNTDQSPSINQHGNNPGAATFLDIFIQGSIGTHNFF